MSFRTSFGACHPIIRSTSPLEKSTKNGDFPSPIPPRLCSHIFVHEFLYGPAHSYGRHTILFWTRMARKNVPQFWKLCRGCGFGIQYARIGLGMYMHVIAWLVALRFVHLSVALIFAFINLETGKLFLGSFDKRKSSRGDKYVVGKENNLWHRVALVLNSIFSSNFWFWGWCFGRIAVLPEISPCENTLMCVMSLLDEFLAATTCLLFKPKCREVFPCVFFSRREEILALYRQTGKVDTWKFGLRI